MDKRRQGGPALTSDTYMLAKPSSNLPSMGALWAWKVRRGGIEFAAHDASSKVELGAMTIWSPILNCLSLMTEGSPTVQQVG